MADEDSDDGAAAIGRRTPDAEQGNRWRRGQSGNPRGKPTGSRNKVLLALDAIGAAGAEAVLRKAVEDAKAGDMRAAEMILSRVWPARKGRPVVLELPPVTTAADLPAALAAVTTAVADGTLTPDEGTALATILDAQRRGIETADLEVRLAALEAANNG
jgi:hypothetical protein